MLFLAANPSDSNRLELDEEVRDIEAKIRSSEHRDVLLLKTRWAVRADDLLQALNEDRPAVVHFSGHGGETGILLHDSSGESRTVFTAALKRLFGALRDNIRAVVLNSCHSEEQALGLVETVGCIVGMRGAANDRAARIFSASFYRALGFGRSIGNAFDQAVAAVSLEGLESVISPRLYVKDGLNPGNITIID